MKAVFKIYDQTNGGAFVGTMEKDASEYYEWIGRAVKRNAIITAVDFNHINVDTQKRFFEITIS